MLSKHVVY
jgi:hypothetical protein